MTQYIAAEGDTVDFIAWRVYGTLEGRVVEQVLEANPGLAAKGDTLPAGTRVQLPAITRAAATTSTKLWE